ncbi:MAG: hypothetical protein M0C28_00670 [Candidatus Moduliflexus flocculans]|nr:hypothetical protein [Candidatus Moduliflexus flocculans]
MLDERRWSGAVAVGSLRQALRVAVRGQVPERQERQLAMVIGMNEMLAHGHVALPRRLGRFITEDEVDRNRPGLRPGLRAGRRPLPDVNPLGKEIRVGARAPAPSSASSAKRGQMFGQTPRQLRRPCPSPPDEVLPLRARTSRSVNITVMAHGPVTLQPTPSTPPSATCASVRKVPPRRSRTTSPS